MGCNPWSPCPRQRWVLAALRKRQFFGLAELNEAGPVHRVLLPDGSESWWITRYEEIEQCLTAHADVAECAVVGYEEEGLQKPRAFVVLREQATPDAAALQAHVKATLSPHKYPRDVRFVDQLPRTGSGKIDRRALREVLV